MAIGTRLRAAREAFNQPTPPDRAALTAAAENYHAQQRAEAARAMPTVLRASGVRITPENAPQQLKALAAQRNGWQKLAWNYRTLIPELRYALRYRANAISRVRIFAAQIDPSDPHADPIPLSLRDDEDKDKAAQITISPQLAQAAEEELALLPLDAGYQFLGVWSENFDVAGEAWLHGYTNPDTDMQEWAIRSVTEIEISGTSIKFKDPLELGRARDIDLDTEEIYRLPVPDPEESARPDSALRSLIDVMEDVVLIGREMRAASRSRAAANGFLKIPRGLVMVKNTIADANDSGESPASSAAEFVNNLTAAITAPINNEGDPGAVAPIGIVGDPQDLDGFQHMQLVREDSPVLLEKLNASLGRLATGIDLPPEILTGMGDANHWGAWQIDASTARHHIEPGVRLMVDALTGAFLRTRLRALGFSGPEVARVRAWYSLDNLTENVNRRQDVLDAHERGLIGDDTTRDGLGFDPSDAPTPQEVLLGIARKQGIEQATAAAILDWFVRRETGQTTDELPQFPAGLEPGAVTGRVEALPPRAPASSAPAGPGQSPTSRTPSTAPPGIAASAARPCTCGWPLTAYGTCGAPNQADHDTVITLAALAAAAPPPTDGVPDGYRLETAAPRALMELERALRDRILVAADAAVLRAVEKGAARVRSKAQGDRELAARLRGVPVEQVGRLVGRAQAYALDPAGFTAGAFVELAKRFRTWVVGAVDAVIERVLAMLGLDGGSRDGQRVAERMRTEMGGRVDVAWDQLEQHLQARADAILFDLEWAEDPEDAEHTDGQIAPGAVRAALATVGGIPETSAGIDEHGRTLNAGEPVGGLANGDTVRRVLEDNGAVEVGYTWVYGITPAARRFHPHHDLEGKRFANWTDPILETANKYGGRYSWIGPYFNPGDHRGCFCDWVPAYAMPDYAQQVRDRLATPPQAMQDILHLAAADDRAGRTGTTAQEQRDRYEHIQKLQARFLKETA